MQFWSSDWLSHHCIWAIIPCSPNMVTERVYSKLKASWKLVVFTNEVGKNSGYFVGVFDKTINPLALVGYETIIANSARGIIVQYNPYRYVCTAPKSMVFAPLRSEKGYRLCPFWSGIRYSFRGNYTGVYERIRRFNSKWISKGTSTMQIRISF